ncbi:MAG: ferritin [Candidatus Omnitrophica bacterium]|nr:ferritin [Candidatus Omnitrophota bacterium]
MEIKNKVTEAINKQINAELYSSYLYLGMASYFESRNWPGFGRWMRIQAQEENSHAMKFFDYVLERGGEVALEDIKACDAKWKTALEVFEAVYAHELKVTELINDLFKVAKQEGDSATESMLKWFIDEQVEEEANAKQIVDKLKLIKDNSNGLFMLDHKLGERK